jgi:transposase
MPSNPSTASPARGQGRPYLDHRRILNGILFVLHTGIPWRDLPERYGPWQTVYSRLRRWTARGLWEHLLSQLQTRLAEEDRIAWTLWGIDGSVVRAHKHAPGARRRRGKKPRRASRLITRSVARGVASGPSCTW